MEDVTPRLEAVFEAAVEHVNKNKYPKNHTLRFYGLYMYITAGKLSEKQSMKMRKRNKAMHDAWKACEDLTLKQAVEDYIKLASEVTPKFKLEEFVELNDEEAKAVADLSSLPPPTLPKGLNEKYLRMKDNSPEIMLHMQRQSGFDPENNAYDDKDRIELHEKLVKYYRAVDPDRLLSGIGEVVDYALYHGAKKLNQKLKNKYGFDLDDIDQREQRRRSSVRPSTKQGQPATIFRTADLKNLTPEDAEELSVKIEKFFSIFDPEKVKRGIDNGFIDLVMYIDRRGEEALNKKLVKKYGKCLTDVGVDEAPPNDFDESSSKLLNLGMANLSTKSSMMLIGRSGNDSFQNLSKEKIETMRRESKSTGRPRTRSEDMALRGPINKIELPSYVKPALVNFYMRYEPNKLKNGSAKKVYSWAKRNGLRKLNKELKRRYKQSLDEFVDDSDKLKVELISFYKKIDATKINTDLEKILSWGIKNGRTALNVKFRKKYGFDLDSYNNPETKKSEKTDVTF